MLSFVSTASPISTLMGQPTTRPRSKQQHRSKARSSGWAGGAGSAPHQPIKRGCLSTHLVRLHVDVDDAGHQRLRALGGRGGPRLQRGRGLWMGGRGRRLSQARREGGSVRARGRRQGRVQCITGCCAAAACNGLSGGLPAPAAHLGRAAGGVEPRRLLLAVITQDGDALLHRPRLHGRCRLWRSAG